QEGPRPLSRVPRVLRTRSPAARAVGSEGGEAVGELRPSASRPRARRGSRRVRRTAGSRRAVCPKLLAAFLLGASSGGTLPARLLVAQLCPRHGRSGLTII